MIRLALLAFVAATSCPGAPHGDPPEFNCSPDVIRQAGGGFQACEWVWRCREVDPPRTYHRKPVTLEPKCLEAH